MAADERVTVEPAAARQRLDRYLATRGTWGSRSQVQRLIAEGYVQLDGQPAKPAAVLRGGETIDVRAAPPTGSGDVQPEPIPLDVLYDDEWLLVINKPAGLVVHPAPGHWRGTLVSALLHRWRGPRPGLDPSRPGIVHRLDKDTSGVLVIAKDAQTLADLGAQFRNRQVEKQYVACVWGRLHKQRGTIAEPIGRNPVHRKRMAVRPGGRAAVTRFEVIERCATVTFVRLYPQTGRTHQLRVHLAAIGHPIVGDAVYGGGRRRDETVSIARQALHAERLAFRHPRTGASMHFTAPVPQDLVELRKRCASAA